MILQVKTLFNTSQRSVFPAKEAAAVAPPKVFCPRRPGATRHLRPAKGNCHAIWSNEKRAPGRLLGCPVGS